MPLHLTPIPPLHSPLPPLTQGDIFLMRDIFERFLTALEDAKLDIDYPSTCIQPCAPSTHSFAPTTPDTSGMQLAHQAAVSPFVIGSGVYLPPAFYTRPSPEALASLLPLAPSTSPPTQGEKAHKPWKSDEGDEKTENGLADLIDPLLIMASSECLLQQREAALALAQLSANGKLPPCSIHSIVSLSFRYSNCPPSPSSSLAELSAIPSGGGLVHSYLLAFISATDMSFFASHRI